MGAETAAGASDGGRDAAIGGGVGVAIGALARGAEERRA
jgi:hypothetical protein